MNLRFLPGFVAGTHNIFAPVSVAVAVPATGLTQGRFEAGAVFDESGRNQRHLFIEDFGRALGDAVAGGLSYAGAQPSVLDESPLDHRPPRDTGFLLLAEPTGVEVNKHFGAETTVHGRYFKMHSEVRLSVQLFDRAGRTIFSGATLGAEDEPPAPVGHEEFLPLETDPAESLSVALARAVGEIVLAPAIRGALGKRK